MSTLVLIGGGSASGKTTIGELVQERFTGLSVRVLSHDDYYRDVSHLSEDEISYYNFDHPDAINDELLVEQIRQLLNGKTIRPPSYDFITHASTMGEQEIEPADIILLEGIFALYYPKLVEMANLKLFVDTDADLRLVRRIERDTTRRGLTVSQVTKMYLQFVKPMHEAFIEPTKRMADLIIPGDRHFDQALRMMDGFFLNDLVEGILKQQKNNQVKI